MANDFQGNCLPIWFCSLGSLTVFGTSSILKQIPLSEQNTFSNYVCKLLNYHLNYSKINQFSYFE